MKLAYLAAANSIHTVRWVNELSRRGHKVHLITMHQVAKTSLIDASIDLHFLRVPPPTGYFLNSYSLRKLLSKIKPALLHTHYASGYGTLARLSNFHPALLSIWGSDVFTFPEETRWKEKLLRLNLAAADRIASTSHAMKKQAERFVVPKHAVAVTPFGVDCEKFKPVDSLRDADGFIIGTIKTLEPGYGIDTLMRAFGIIINNYQSPKRLRLLIAGKGVLRGKLESLAIDLGIAGRTQFLGYVPHTDVPRVLNQLSVFVSVSNSESFGVAVLEASACGVPAIVSDVGGLPEVVRNGVTGTIVPSGNPEALAKAMMDFIENEELAKSVGDAGRDFVVTHYEWGESVSRMERLYESIVNLHK